MPFLLISIILVIILLLVALRNCHHQTEKTNGGVAIDPSLTASIGIPRIAAGDEIVRHKGYTLCYSEPDEQARWVAYLATADHAAHAYAPRTDRFLVDPLVATGSATGADYEGSGYDRGHLAPAEDMAWSAGTMKESFYYSNMSPQVPNFNRGVWKRLEELLRFWATEYDSLYIVTGPVLGGDLPVIGPDKVKVPHYFYKTVLRYKTGDVEAIGFVLPNEPSAATLMQFAVPVDSVEGLTGLDLYPSLPEDVESAMHLRRWKWTRR